MRITVLSHNLSSNAAMRAHGLAAAVRSFADVTLIGPARRAGPWPALPDEPWTASVRKRRFPEFASGFLELVERADGDVLLAVKPQLASFGVALVAAERRGVPVVLDVDDLDIALAPRDTWDVDPVATDLTRPGSAVYVALLTRAIPGAAAVIASSSALADRFGGTLVPHGTDTHQFDPSTVDRAAARARFGFASTTVLFPGTPRTHKGIEQLMRAVARVPDARLAVTCRPDDTVVPGDDDRVMRVPIVPHDEMPALLAAADVVAIPQLDNEAARHQMPMKVYDAMAMARPIVASAVSDLPVVLEGCGVVVRPGDVDALAGALEAVVTDTDRATAMGARARERCVERYSRAAVARVLHGVVDRVIP